MKNIILIINILLLCSNCKIDREYLVKECTNDYCNFLKIEDSESDYDKFLNLREYDFDELELEDNSKCLSKDLSFQNELEEFPKKWFELKSYKREYYIGGTYSNLKYFINNEYFCLMSQDAVCLSVTDLKKISTFHYQLEVCAYWKSAEKFKYEIFFIDNNFEKAVWKMNDEESYDLMLNADKIKNYKILSEECYDNRNNESFRIMCDYWVEYEKLNFEELISNVKIAK